MVTLAASSLASASVGIKWSQLPAKESVPKLPTGVQRMHVAKASSFVGHMSMDLRNAVVQAFQQHLNMFEKPCELAAIEKAGVFFEQFGD